MRKNIITILAVTAVWGMVLLVRGAWSDTAALEVVDLKCVKRFERPVAGHNYLSTGEIDPSPEVIPLEHLPKDDCGFVDWTEAHNQGSLEPRDSIMEKRVENVYAAWPGDIEIKAKEPVKSDVVFPHDIHNELLECKSCHNGIFEQKAGSAEMSMSKIWAGEYCGRCHGKVAFPLSSCYRCHTNTPVLSER